MKFSMWLIDPRPDLPTIVQLVEKGFELSDSLSKKFFLIHGHFEPRGQYAPEFREGLCQDVSSADEIGVAYVIAGDTSKHLCAPWKGAITQWETDPPGNFRSSR